MNFFGIIVVTIHKQVTKNVEKVKTKIKQSYKNFKLEFNLFSFRTFQSIKNVQNYNCKSYNQF